MTNDALDRRAPAPMPIGARLVGILLSPRRTYEAVLPHGQWLDVLVLTTVASAGALAALLATSIGPQAWVDSVVATAESWGITVSDPAYARLEGEAVVARFANPAAILVVTPLMTALLAALLVVACNAWLGAKATFRQGLALVAHSGVVALVQRLVMLPRNYLAETLSASTNLGVYFPALSETGFLASFLGAIDLFVIWRGIVLAIGLSVLYGRGTQQFAWALLSAYGVIALVAAAVKAAFTGGA